MGDRMRTFASPPPVSIVDPSTGAPRFGAYRGALPRVDWSPLGRGPLSRIAHHKRWIYAAIVSGDLCVAAAVVRLGYLANAFTIAFDRAERRVLFHRASLAPTLAARVGDTAGEGCHASFRGPGLAIDFARPEGGRDYRLEIRARGLDVSARLASAPMPSPLSIVADLGGGLANATEKGALMPVIGEAIVAGSRRDLDGGLGGYDYTNGLLERHTRWRWGFALGHARDGRRFALNLVEAPALAGECGAWIGDELVALDEGRFSFDPGAPLSPWSVRTADGALDLRFEPGGMHSDFTNAGIVRARFVQPIGTFSGSLRIPGRDPVELDRVLGVVEDQDVLW
jgi:hypothetical protein